MIDCILSISALILQVLPQVSQKSQNLYPVGIGLPQSSWNILIPVENQSLGTLSDIEAGSHLLGVIVTAKKLNSIVFSKGIWVVWSKELHSSMLDLSEIQASECCNNRNSATPSYSYRGVLRPNCGFH